MISDSLASYVAANVIVERSRRGMTQQQLADLAGLSRATLNQIENERADPRLSTLEALGRALGVDVDELIAAREMPSRRERRALG